MYEYNCPFCDERIEATNYRLFRHKKVHHDHPVEESVSEGVIFE